MIEDSIVLVAGFISLVLMSIGGTCALFFAADTWVHDRRIQWVVPIQALIFGTVVGYALSGSIVKMAEARPLYTWLFTFVIILGVIVGALLAGRWYMRRMQVGLSDRLVALTWGLGTFAPVITLILNR